MQSRWQAAQQRQERAAAAFEKPAAEAAQIKQSLLRFFDLRFKKSPEGQKRLMAIRADSGDAERRLRAAAEYWYAGTDKMKDYAPFPVSRGAHGGGEEEGADGGEPEEAEPEDGESEAGESGDDEPGDDGQLP
ncbi:hypothetical protein [Sorangium cellulosum]|uniref:hypothetical protein n=1 Tax=Sorangium cellulosum TaxID=56 RepID=UPI00031DAF17|nr:hypothetical protein [Sorangium cellulosum]